MKSNGHKGHITHTYIKAARCPQSSLTMTGLKAGGTQVILDVGGERFIAARETLTLFPATRSGTHTIRLNS